jgi:hypothetical protein
MSFSDLALRDCDHFELRRAAYILKNLIEFLRRKHTMRPVHRHRKFNPKKFTLGQFLASPYILKRIKSGKKPYRIGQTYFTEQSNYPQLRKRRGTQPPKRNVNYILENKYKNIVQAARYHPGRSKNLDHQGKVSAGIRFVAHLLRADGHGGNPLSRSKRIARNPFDPWIARNPYGNTPQSSWKYTGSGPNDFEDWPGYAPIHPAWG